MAEETDDDAPEGGEAEGSGGKKKLAGKKLVLFVALPALLLLIGGGVAFFMLSGGDGAKDTQHAEAGDGAADGHGGTVPGAVFMDLPEMLVNLNTGGKRNSYLKITVALELAKQEDVARLTALMPRVVDNFQVYLRELRLDDLNGSEGLMRLKEELLVRVNAAAGTIPVKDVLFKEMLVQ